MKRLRFALVMILSVSVLVTSVGVAAHVHTWEPWRWLKQPTCISYGEKIRYCSECGESEKTPVYYGDHSYQGATCVKPETCRVCGKTRGEPLGHAYADATCMRPRTCTRCNDEDGTRAPHSYAPATCTTPSTCRVCGLIRGDALGHAWVTKGDIVECTRCHSIRRNAPRPPQY